MKAMLDASSASQVATLVEPNAPGLADSESAQDWRLIISPRILSDDLDDDDIFDDEEDDDLDDDLDDEDLDEEFDLDDDDVDDDLDDVGDDEL